MGDKLDSLDMKILSALLNNCRESDRQIGRRVGISSGVVKSRIKKMEESGVIEYYTLKIEPPVFGYGLFYIVVTGRDTSEILCQVKLIGEPFIVVPCIGGITVCGIVVKENIQQKIELAKNLMKDVRVLSIFEDDNTKINSNLTKTDLDILGELMKNPREKIENIAKKITLSTKTITRSIEKLQDNEAIQFTLVYDPIKISGFIPYAVLTWVNRNLSTISQRLEKRFHENFLQIPFITKNQIVLFLYSNNIYKLDDITQKVREIQGVDSADLFIPKKITFPKHWVQNAIKEAKKSSTLHLIIKQID
jgi:DNA-binding Lrp family transcriptional regulator